MIETRDIAFLSIEHYRAISALLSEPAEQKSGRDIAIRALTGSETASLVGAYIDGKIVGAASYRIDGGGIKRINTGAVIPRIGIGSALVRHIIRKHPGLPMWCKSLRQANGWCERLGMRPGQIVLGSNPANDFRIYRWTAGEADQFVVDGPEGD